MWWRYLKPRSQDSNHQHILRCGEFLGRDGHQEVYWTHASTLYYPGIDDRQEEITPRDLVQWLRFLRYIFKMWRVFKQEGKNPVKDAYSQSINQSNSFIEAKSKHITFQHKISGLAARGVPKGIKIPLIRDT